VNDLQVMGLKITLIFLIPIAIIYWMRATLTPVKPKKEAQLLLPHLTPQKIYKFRPSTLRLCTFHLTSLPEGRIALVVDKKDCGVCQKEKYGTHRI
jgi:hypothetical protein